MHTPETIARTFARIQDQIAQNPILLYMKGTPQFPQCGFSGRVVHILKLYGVECAHVNILEDLEIRAALPQYNKWPTFPQLYIKGKFIGGCDIVTELHESGKLQNEFNLMIEG